MKVLLISNYLPLKQKSMLRYAEMLRSELLNAGWNVTMVHPPAILGRARIAAPGKPWTKWLQYIDMFLFAPFYLRWKARSVDLIHVCDHSNSMYLPCAGTKPAVITCHDLLAVRAARGDFPGVQVGATGRIYQTWILSNLVRARNIICDSGKTENDLRTLVPGLSGETRVIHIPLVLGRGATDKKKTDQSPPGLALGTYLLHVGGSWYKNRLGVLKIFAALRNRPRFEKVRLVMVGPSWESDLTKFSSSQGLDEHVLRLHDLSDEELQDLYTGALALLFPSWEEGFGWPILEAQACGCPVITSNRQPMAEIAGDAAILVDPGSPDDAAAEILRRLEEFPDLRERGFRNVSRFALNDAIRSHMDLYDAMMKSAPAA
jgi:glycosyltransferase involved in cell wall biosynthesis